MSTAAGIVSFVSPGVKTILIGIPANDITFFPDSSATIGYADHSFQFSRTTGLSNDHSKISVYNTAGTKIAEFTVTGWGAATFTCNVTFLSGICTIPLIART